MICLESKIESNNIDFHQLVEHSLNSIWIIRPDKKILYCNKSSLELLKLASPKDILYKSLYAFIPPDTQDSSKELLKRILEKQEIAKLAEAKMIKSDRETIDV